MALKLQLQLQQLCDVCHAARNDQRRKETAVSVVLFGSCNPYAVCPGCLQETDYSTRHDPEYRRKARVMMYQKYGIVARMP